MRRKIANAHGIELFARIERGGEKDVRSTFRPVVLLGHTPPVSNAQLVSSTRDERIG